MCYLSYSKHNVAPQKYIEEYLAETYEENFTYLSTEYCLTDDGKYHLWQLLFF